MRAALRLLDGSRRRLNGMLGKFTRLDAAVVDQGRAKKWPSATSVDEGPGMDHIALRRPGYPLTVLCFQISVTRRRLVDKALNQRPDAGRI